MIISLNKNKYNNKFAKQNVALFLIADPIYAHPPVHRWQKNLSEDPIWF
jgi:hypothetical protein